MHQVCVDYRCNFSVVNATDLSNGEGVQSTYSYFIFFIRLKKPSLLSHSFEFCQERVRWLYPCDPDTANLSTVSQIIWFEICP